MNALPQPARLPHRYPFLIIDRVVDTQSGHWIRAELRVARNNPLLTPEGILPAVFLIEAIAQAGALLYNLDQDLPSLLGLENVTFPAFARAGDQVLLYTEALWLRNGIGRANGVAHRDDGTLLCALSLTFALTPRDAL